MVRLLQILIVYDSKTGHTEKMAFAVAEGVKEAGGVDVVVKNVDKTTSENLLKADGIIVGSPTYYGQMSSKVKAMFDESVKIHGKLEGKVGAAFTSSGGVASGAETTIISILEAMLIHGMVIQGRSHAEHYGAAAVGKPKEREEERCRELGKMVADLVLKLKP
ncbi:NAD(P)H-dependent oxidoreductase [Candidatus Bathyarchaeota archaeon]|nr:NAD(P)H-dependent oxidoreductase [Candidatus Bathyarchaeota archaeon]